MIGNVGSNKEELVSWSREEILRWGCGAEIVDGKASGIICTYEVHVQDREIWRLWIFIGVD